MDGFLVTICEDGNDNQKKDVLGLFDDLNNAEKCVEQNADRVRNKTFISIDRINMTKIYDFHSKDLPKSKVYKALEKVNPFPKPFAGRANTDLQVDSPYIPIGSGAEMAANNGNAMNKLRATS